uniref:Phospholipid-transporting ATPase n=1 Tax=Terrapene triunguis TaxID=2587831 RepID=A0A674ITA2_9SAUR
MPLCPSPMNNSIKTSKYNFFTFLPLNLFEQFQRIANAYFLFLLILQLIPQVSSLSWFTTVVPLVLVLTVSGAKDAIDDFVTSLGRFFCGCVSSYRPGFICVQADLLLLSSSEPHSLTYIETAELDGETNLKVKQALTVTAELGENLQKLTDFNGEVKCEAPNNKLDKFTGTLTLHGEKFALDNEKMLLRGCTIRNTEWCFGLVIYAGPDTKLMQNCGKTTFKRTSIDRLMNVLVLVVSLINLSSLLQPCSSLQSAPPSFLTNEGTSKGTNEKKKNARKFMFYDHSLVEAVKLDDAATHRFFRLLSLCHTVMPEEKKAGNLVYQAQSPDEGALVTAARNFGFVFRARTPETITVVEMGETKVYELLAILDFNNVRKRMSVIVRSPEGDLTLYCKGADTIVYELLDASCESLKEETMEHLNEFAGEGLRTLVVAYKNLQEDYFEEWHKRHHEASTALDEREEKLSELYEEIEKDLMLLGATAIEDKLQDGVPQTIETLAKAHIKIWVLTGDKQETAVNIGYSCNMLHDDMKDVFIIEGHTSEAVLDELRTARKKMNPDSFLDSDEINIKFENPSMKSRILPEEQANGVYGLVINGHSLAYALEGNLELELVRTACMCKVVICCRVTPLQKAQVVELVKKYKKAVTLAIGDGANDVSMIKTAHIGVGISGQEGMQAVLSSDFSFAQFRYLQRLLLVHGRWSYIRMCKFLRYFFYKNFAFTLVHFWYGFFSGFSAQTVYDQWFITLYNLVYTSLPVLGMSLFDQDVDDRWSMQFPHLYEPGQQNLYFNKIEFVKCVLHGIYSSLILFFIPYGAMYDAVRSDGKAIADYQSFALMAQTCLLIVVSVQIGLDTAYWTAVNQFFIWGSLSVYFAIIFTMYSDGMYLIFTASFPFIGTARNTLSQPNVWLAIFLSIILCVLPVVGGRFLKAQLMPTVSDKSVSRGLGLRSVRVLPGLAPGTRLRRTSTRRSGYAFSHQHGFGALIMSGRNMRPKLPFTTTGTFSPNSEKNKHK